MNNQNDPQFYNDTSSGYPQYNNVQNSNAYMQYNNVQNSNAYMQYNNVQNSNAYMQYNNMQIQAVPETKNARNRASMVFGLVSMVFLLVGVLAPAIDFSAYHASVQIQYSLMKICQNVGLISAMWMGIPYGILIAAVLMGILAFVDIPQLKLVPSIIVIIMIILMVADIGNVVEWVIEMIEKFSDKPYTASGSGVGAGQVIKSFMIGFYCLIAGIVTGFVSCFVKRREA